MTCQCSPNFGTFNCVDNVQIKMPVCGYLSKIFYTDQCPGINRNFANLTLMLLATTLKNSGFGPLSQASGTPKWFFSLLVLQRLFMSLGIYKKRQDFYHQIFYSEAYNFYFLWYWEQKLHHNEGMEICKSPHWWMTCLLFIIIAIQLSGRFRSRDGMLENKHTMPKITCNTILYHAHYLLSIC